ncbi:MAG: hypothetical protein RBT86_09895, partial [Azospira sp.]|nr:hypothetical protein [Azospira sp.]
MKAFLVSMSMASTSSGHTSTHTVQPFSAMHLSLSTLTGTWVGVAAMVMANSLMDVSVESGGFGVAGDTQALIGA